MWISEGIKDVIVNMERRQDSLALLGKDSPYYLEYLQNLRIETKKKHTNRRREQIALKNMHPCPVCGSNNIEMYHSVSYGHGDSTFISGIKCNSCGIMLPSKGGYGNEPDIDTKLEVINHWNNLTKKN